MQCFYILCSGNVTDYVYKVMHFSITFALILHYINFMSIFQYNQRQYLLNDRDKIVKKYRFGSLKMSIDI